MKYTNSYQISVTCEPFFTEDGGNFKLSMLQINEQLWGTLAGGIIKMTHNGSKAAMMVIEEVNSGILKITDEKEGGLRYTIPFFIQKRIYRYNYYEINIVCKERAFFNDLHTDTFSGNINSILELKYGKDLIKNIRTDSDLPDNLTYHQTNQTDQEFLIDLCFAYKKSSIFGFGWEGLLIKDILGEKNSNWKIEDPENIPFEAFLETGLISQVSHRAKIYNPKLYNHPYNPWENKEKEYNDYTEVEPGYVRFVKEYDKIHRMHKDYYQLRENDRFNRLYAESNFFNKIVIKDSNIPKYKLGDVVKCYDVNKLTQELNDPYKLYLVKSNELFYATGDTPDVDQEGNRFSWRSILLGLQEDETVGIGNDIDPIKRNEE